jgi:hypothetical protein
MGLIKKFGLINLIHIMVFPFRENSQFVNLGGFALGVQTGRSGQGERLI